MLTTFKRVFGFALTDFYRNRGLAVAAIFILFVTVILATSLFFLRGISNFLISEVQQKIDITAYFIQDAKESDILAAKDQVIEMQYVTDVKYVSEDDALANFTQKHKDNPAFQDALDQVGTNPLLPSLNITTDGNPSHYAQIENNLQQSSFAKLIDHIDFSQKKDIIERVFSITTGINNFVLGLIIIVALVALLIVFNTTKLAVANSKEEINTMRIVGASNWFVRWPFIIQGALYGFIAFLICILLTFVVAYLFSDNAQVIMPGFSLITFFTDNILMIIIIQVISGMGLGAISSFFAVRKYLKN